MLASAIRKIEVAKIFLATHIEILPIIDLPILEIELMPWKKADIVQLVSGGPDMTVEEVTPGNEVFCVWFEGKKVHRDSFDAALLKVPTQSGIGTLSLSR